MFIEVKIHRVRENLHFNVDFEGIELFSVYNRAIDWHMLFENRPVVSKNVGGGGGGEFNQPGTGKHRKKQQLTLTPS